MNTAKNVVTPEVTLDQLADMLKKLDGGADAAATVATKVDSLDAAVPKEDIVALNTLAELETPPAVASTPETAVNVQCEQMPLDVGEAVLAELESQNASAKKGKRIKQPTPEAKPQPAVKQPATINTIPKEQRSQPKGRFDLMGMNDEDWLKVGLATSAETSLNLIRECPVKVQDKALNLVQWMLRGHLLSVFTELCIAQLVKDGAATTSSLRAMLMSNPDKMYSVGTAGSQAGQMMKLLPAMGIAKLEGKTLVLNSGSPLVKFFRKVSTKA